MMVSFPVGGGLSPAPVALWLAVALGLGQDDAAGERHGVELDGEPAVAVAPGHSDAVPVAGLVFAVSDLVSHEAGPAVGDGGGASCVCCRSCDFSLLVLRAAPCGLSRGRPKPRSRGAAHRAAENRGDLQGNRFSACPARRRL